MATINGDNIRVAARQILDGTEEVVNTHYFTVISGATGDDADMLTEVQVKLSEAWETIESSIVNNQVPLDLVVYNISQDYPLGSVPWSAAYTGGTATGNMNAAQVALLVIWQTAVKRKLGRTYIGGIGSSALVDGFWDAGVIAAVDGWADLMRNPTPTDDAISLSLRVHSRVGGGLSPITNARIIRNPSTLTRRRRGRGS